MIEMSVKTGTVWKRNRPDRKEDEIYARNQILEVLGMDEYEEPSEIVGTISLEDTLNELTDYAAEHGSLKTTALCTGSL